MLSHLTMSGVCSWLNTFVSCKQDVYIDGNPIYLQGWCHVHVSPWVIVSWFLASAWIGRMVFLCISWILWEICIPYRTTCSVRNEETQQTSMQSKWVGGRIWPWMFAISTFLFRDGLVLGLMLALGILSTWILFYVTTMYLNSWLVLQKDEPSTMSGSWMLNGSLWVWCQARSQIHQSWVEPLFPSIVQALLRASYTEQFESSPISCLLPPSTSF